jgi:hypothetical protein
VHHFFHIPDKPTSSSSLVSSVQVKKNRSTLYAEMDSPQIRRARNGPIPFLCDPHQLRGPPLDVIEDEFLPLGRPAFLSTSLIDYLLQRSLPMSLPADVLIGSSNALPYLQHYTNLFNSTSRTDERTVRTMKRQYHYYSMRHFEFLGINCTQSHFFVIKVGFDIRRNNVFDTVRIYDSLRRTGRHNDTVNNNSVGATFLRSFQSFVVNYVFYDMPNVEQLKADPNFILKTTRISRLSPTEQRT